MRNRDVWLWRLEYAGRAASRVLSRVTEALVWLAVAFAVTAFGLWLLSLAAANGLW